MLGKAIQPEIEAMIAGNQFDELRELLTEELDVADIAEVLEDLSTEDRALLFRLLPTRLASEVFELLAIDSQEKLIEELSHDRVAQIVNAMSPDDHTKLLEELPGEVAQRLLRVLNPEELRVARALLGYPEDSIGRAMTPEYIAVRPDWTISAVIDYIRQNAPRVETINFIYVTDEKGRLIDDLRIGQLLLADPKKVLREILDEQYVALAAYDDQEVAVEAFKKYDRFALPVTDSRGILVGIVTADDVLDIAEEEVTEDVQKFGGQEALEDGYFATSILRLTRKRAGWLSLLLGSSSLTAVAMDFFSPLTLKLAFLAIFIPMIVSSGGNSGSQSASLIIRGLAVKEIELSHWWRVFRRELATGLMLGLFLGSIVFVFLTVIHARDRNEIKPVLVTDHNPPPAAVKVTAPPPANGLADPALYRLPLLVLLSITGVVLIGTLVGSMLPFIFKGLGFDPAVCSAPFIATFVDVSGIILYFTIARWLYHMMV